MRVRDNCDHKRKAINASGHLYCFDCGKFTGPRALDEIESLQQQLAASTEAAAEFKSLHEAVCTSLRGCESQLAAANARVEALEGLAYSVLDAVAVADGRSIECYGRRYQIPGSIRDALEALAAARGE